MNASRPLPNEDDVRRCLSLIEISSILFILIVAAPLYMFVGINLQIFTEDILIRGVEWISRLAI